MSARNLKKGMTVMNNEKIMSFFCELTGLSLAEAEEKDELIGLSKGEVEDMLIDEADSKKDIPELEFFAAAISAYKHFLFSEGEGISSVRVGDVNLTKENGESKKSRLLEIMNGARIGARKYLKDESFFFGGVR